MSQPKLSKSGTSPQKLPPAQTQHTFINLFPIVQRSVSHQLGLIGMVGTR